MASEVPEPKGTEPAPLDRLLAHFAPRLSGIGRFVHLLILLAVSVAAGFVMSPGLSGNQIPLLDESDLGRPSRSTLKAGRDYEIANSALTEKRREDARASVRPVFDLDPSVSTGIVGDVQAVFGRMRAIAYSSDAASAGNVDAAEVGAKKREDAQEAYRRLLAARSELEHDLAALEDEDFQALAQARFSPEVERAALLLVERAYRPTGIVGAREELVRVGEKGITVRTVGAGREEQLSHVNAPRIRDLREAQDELDLIALPLLPDLQGNVRRAVVRLVKRVVRPNLTINIAETDTRRRHAAEAVKDAVVQIKRGQKVLGDGELINDTHLVIVRGMRSQADPLDLLQVKLGGTGLVALLIGCVYAFCRAAFRRFRPTRKDALLLAVLMVAMLAVVQVWVTVADAVHDKYSSLPLDGLHYAVPIAAGAMLVRFLLSQELALFFSVVMACLGGTMLGNSLEFGIYSLVGSLVAADRISRAKDRAGILRAGLVTGVVSAVAVLVLSLAQGKGASSEALISAGLALVGNALAAPTLLMALTPLIETTLGYASDMKLLELANLNHPALKELIVQAPGTYHHSIIVGSLVESAAEAIGANPLLARSCAYYHDIGKGRNPLYFGENQKGENRHDTLAPAMSAVIIKRHVTEGMEMARQYNLPKLVADAIPQHHGTRLVGYFFHKALKEQEGKESPAPVDEAVYRYVGPKPQFREAALVMIADAVEAASRAMPDQSSAKLQGLVQKLINLIFSEGQLDECDLTLKDLNLIAQAFVHTLEGIYHARPSYPAGAVGGPRPTNPGDKGLPVRTTEAVKRSSGS